MSNVPVVSCDPLCNGKEHIIVPQGLISEYSPQLMALIPINGFNITYF